MIESLDVMNYENPQHQLVDCFLSIVHNQMNLLNEAFLYYYNSYERKV